MDSTSNEWYLTGVQLEIGSQATPFEHEPVGVTLSKCQRYFYRIDRDNGTGNAVYASGEYVANNHRLTITHPVTMRTTPTVTAAFNTSGVTIDYRSSVAASFYKTSAYRMDSSNSGNFYQADAELS